jgi:hypothetical protein
MIRRNLLLVLVLLLLESCANSHNVPDDILPPSKMQAVLWDMFRAGNFVTSFQLAADTTLKREKEQIKWFNRVLQVHQVKEKQFKKSIEYYKTRPDLLSVIMDSLSRKSLTPVVRPLPEVKSVE